MAGRWLCSGLQLLASLHVPATEAQLNVENRNGYFKTLLEKETRRGVYFGAKKKKNPHVQRVLRIIRENVYYEKLAHGFQNPKEVNFLIPFSKTLWSALPYSVASTPALSPCMETLPAQAAGKAVGRQLARAPQSLDSM